MKPELALGLLDAQEAQRLRCLRSLAILDTPPDPALDALTRAVAATLDCPIALVSLVDDERQWFKSHHGLALTQTPRDMAFCAHALTHGRLLEVPDAKADARFRDNPLVTGEPGIRFYAGAPLIVQGHTIGTLCVIDRQPRQLTAQQVEALTALAKVAVAVIERSAAQRRTELSEVRLADTLRAASDFHWEVDSERRFTWVSQGVEALLGVTPASLVGATIWNPFVLDAMGEHLADKPTLHQSLATGQDTLRLLVELPTHGPASPPRRPVLLSAVPVLGLDNAPLGWRGTAKDVSMLLEGVRRSRELEARLSSIAAQLPGVIFMLERHHSGHLRLPYASERLLEVFGLRPEAAVDDALALFAHVPEAQRSELLRGLVQSAEFGGDWTFECSVTGTAAAKRWVGGRATPTQLADGRQVWYGYAADFTERRQAAQAIAGAQRRLQQALDVGRLGVLSIDLGSASFVADATALQLHGLPSQTTRPRPLAAWLACIAPPDLAAVNAAIATTQQPGEPITLRYRLATGGDGAQLELQLDAGDAPGRLLGLCRDITEQERGASAQREKASAELAQRQQTEFLSRVSHELRTPMNAILGFVDLMRTDQATPLAPQHRHWTGHVMSAGQRLMSLINDLLDLTRIDSGHHTLELRSCVVLELIDASQGLLLPLAQQKPVSLMAPTGKIRLQVLADRRGLEQVLVNVFANAIKFNVPHCGVRCHIEAQAERALIHISDEGPGIPAERRDRLFQPFERLGRAQTSPEGSGLGLAISRSLVEAMHGRISASFPAQGGTCITIELPLAADSVDTVPGRLESLAAAARPANTATTAAPRRAIYADDNPVNALLLKAMFAMRSDWTLDTVDSASELRAAVAQTRFALVILDIHLGSESGIDLLHELRQDPSLSGVRFVALSADSQPAQIAHALQAGFDDYWTNPIELAELHHRLDKLALLQCGPLPP